MKFLRNIFTNSIIALICLMLAIFGVGMGLLSWHDGQPFIGILYAVTGVAVFVVGRIIGNRGDGIDDMRDRWRNRR